jgi:hypothetical protein
MGLQKQIFKQQPGAGSRFHRIWMIFRVLDFNFLSVVKIKPKTMM